jgi:membrane fusion protein, multidrug efflux system
VTSLRYCRSASPFLLSFMLAACSQGGGNTAPAAQAGPAGAAMPPPPEVEVVTVAPSSVPRTVELPGRLQGVRTAQVRARIEGILETQMFKEGTDVSAGQPLFKIDPRVLAANVGQAKANLVKAEAEVFVARQTVERTRELAKQGMLSQQALDQAEAKLRQAEAEVGVVKAAQTRAEIDLSYASVTAPISGRIGRALVTEGSLVGKGEATHLATIEQSDPIWVNFSQSASDFMRLREAFSSGKAKPARQSAVKLLLENGSEYPLPGKLIFTDLAVDPANGSVNLRAEFANPQRMLLPGQFVTLRLPVAEAEGVITVPQRAVQASSQGQIVMLVGAENKVTPRPVKTGGLSGTNWIVLEGLKGGEQVIVNGLQKARPGSPVTPVALDVKPAAPAAPASGAVATATPARGLAAAPAAAAAAVGTAPTADRTNAKLTQ